MFWYKWLLALVAVGLLSLHALTQGPAAKKAATPGEIEQLIKQLDSSSYQEREATGKKLEAIGSPALDALRRAAAPDNDLETRRRAERLISRIENGLDALLAAYRAYGLPLPPPQARLMRYIEGDTEIEGKVVRFYSLAFEMAATTREEGPGLLIGTSLSREAPQPTHLEGPPDLETVKDFMWEDSLCLAIQCHARGWDKLAHHLLEINQQESQESPRKQLVQRAWSYWCGQITAPKIDRGPVARRLQDLMRRHRELDTEYHRRLLHCLELALVPSKARPGSIDALIDALVDYGPDPRDVGIFGDGDAYWRVVAQGFDAVPAIIEHLEDYRLTRGGVANLITPPRHRLVADTASDILNGLAGNEPGWLFKKADAKKWWQEARKQGEEAYLLSHVLPTDGKSPVRDHVLKLILVKYPRHVPSLYRTVLDRRAELDSGLLAEALLHCRMPDQDRWDLLLHAAGHKQSKHRLAALRIIKEIDPKQYQPLLLSAIDNLPKDIPGAYWTCSEAYLAALAGDADDPRVWQALERAAQRAAVGLRMEMLEQLYRRPASGHVPQMLSLLSRSLDDATVRDLSKKRTEEIEGPCAASRYRQIEVRNYVAMRMATLLGIGVREDENRTAEAWAQLRGKVRATYQRKLDGGERKRGPK